MGAWTRFKKWLTDHRRNDAYFDRWSVVHLITGILGGWLMDPFVALLILVLWEPLEILVLSPLAKRLLDKRFGFESLRNSLSDIAFDGLGVAAGFWLLRRVVEPPFQIL